MHYKINTLQFIGTLTFCLSLIFITLFHNTSAVDRNSNYFPRRRTNSNGIIFPGLIRLEGRRFDENNLPSASAGVGRSLSLSSGSNDWAGVKSKSKVTFPPAVESRARPYQLVQTTPRTTTPKTTTTKRTFFDYSKSKYNWTPFPSKLAATTTTTTTVQTQVQAQTQAHPAEKLRYKFPTAPPVPRLRNKKLKKIKIRKKGLQYQKGKPKQYFTRITPPTTTEKPVHDLKSEEESSEEKKPTTADTEKSGSAPGGAAASSPMASVINDFTAVTLAPGVDPRHPAVQAMIATNKDRLTHGHRTPKRLKHGHDGNLIELDKTILYVGMILSWTFWIVVFITYYKLGLKHGHGNPALSPGKEIHVHHMLPPGHGPPGHGPGRSLDVNVNSMSNSSMSSHAPHHNWLTILQMISLAQEAYEKFDSRSLECQKKSLCELAKDAQTQAGGNENADLQLPSTILLVCKRLLDAAEFLSFPEWVSTYLAGYRDAIELDEYKECRVVYPKCSFSMKEVLLKYRRLAYEE